MYVMIAMSLQKRLGFVLRLLAKKAVSIAGLLTATRTVLPVKMDIIIFPKMTTLPIACRIVPQDLDLTQFSVLREI